MKKLAGLLALFVVIAFIACQKEVSLEFGSPATGALRAVANQDCDNKTVAGTYIANKAINDSNFIEVSVAVTTPGPYTITTDTVNGYYFNATGTFTATGNNTVRLKGYGRPGSAGENTFIAMFSGSICFVKVTVLPVGSTGGPAVFTLQGAGGSCGNFVPQGIYYKDTMLDSRHTVQMQVNVSAVGSYSIRTDTVNGYYFFATNTFGATGLQTVTLTGAGKPLAAGTNTFTVKTGTQTCTFPITVQAGTPAAGSCGTANGTYTVGTALTAANTISITHTYATTGSFSVTSGNITNGYSFGTTTVNATAGTAATITLTGTGMPVAAGTNAFTVSFGDGTSCTFSVTVGAATPVTNNDYFPLTQNNWWSYDYQTDTFKVMVSGTQTYSGNTYQKFVYSDAVGPFFEELYRKDAATNFYYQSVDTATLRYLGVVFSQPRLNVLFLKNTLTTNATWTSADFAATYNGIPIAIRYNYKCTDANATVTWNGKTFTNVYKVELTYQVKDPTGAYQDIDGPYEYHYAKGIGLIWTDFNIDDQTIRFWKVN